MSDISERSKIEIQLATYKEIAAAVDDAETLKFIHARIADLERRLPATRT